MAKSLFKEGDVVIVDAPSGSFDFDKGDILTITQSRSTIPNCRRNSDGEEGYVRQDCVKLYEAKQTTTTPSKFKVGDKVRIRQDAPQEYGGHEIGYVGVITSKNHDETKRPHCWFIDDDYYNSEDDMELVDDESVTARFKFKKGDRVRAIRNSPWYDVGYIGTVDEDASDVPYVNWDTDCKNKCTAADQDNLELVKEPPCCIVEGTKSSPIPIFVSRDPATTIRKPNKSIIMSIISKLKSIKEKEPVKSLKKYGFLDSDSEATEEAMRLYVTQKMIADSEFFAENVQPLIDEDKKSETK
jgi:hypothetical protein